MENASKALTMAASILLGIMIISIGVALFYSFGGTGKQIIEQIEQSKIDEFNAQFLKFYGEKSVLIDKTNDIYELQSIDMTIHDVVTLAYLANKNNKEHEVENQSSYSEGSYYIQVDLKNNEKLEKKDENALIDLIKGNDLIYYQETLPNGKKIDKTKTKYYKMTEAKISTITKRIIYIKIEEDTNKNKT